VWVSLAVLSTFLAAGPPPANAVAAHPGKPLELPAVFGDHMVLQRNQQIPVWGTARPGGTVAVSLAGQRAETTAGPDGHWQVQLGPLPAGGPHEMRIAGDTTVSFSDVLVGEVWLASGQSNMTMPLAGWGRILDYETEISRADYPEIRLFQVERVTASQPLTDVAGAWRPTTPDSVAEFSATAYFFARRLYRETGLPIGILHSSWGGTVAEAWTSTETLDELSDFREAAREIRTRTPQEAASLRAAFEEAQAARDRRVEEEDSGLATRLADGTPAWAAPELDLSGWSAMPVPGKWEDSGLPDLVDLDGVVWFRREVEIPESWSGHDLLLNLGPIDDADDTYFNGTLVGSMQQWDEPRVYPVPAALVQPGRNVLVVRAIDTYFGGGFGGDPADLRLTGPAGGEIPLAGPWAYRVGLELDPLPLSPDDPNQPTVLYNGMIRPLAPYALRGVIWYQGESNSSRAYQYRTLFPALIRDWRSTWGQGHLPFYFVQLAAFEPGLLERDKWPELREAQLLALSLPETGMAVAIDIGNPRDVHPKNKQEVGNRLARLALHRIYGRDIADSGPLYRAASVEGSRLRLTFDDAAGGLEAKGGALAGFTVAGEDRQFYPAEARIEGTDAVVLWSDAVKAPRAARYGWEDSPRCNLYNAAGLPAAPFRTDDWPSLTEGAR
jgi:sialate O-acetylesterase